MFMGIRMGVPALLGGSFSPATLFATAGSRGFFYDFSDYSTQFTNTAGTTAITGVGQSLARVNDKSGLGNNATQATAGLRALTQVRPMFTQRNRAVGSELPENTAYWVTSSTINGVTMTKVASGIDTDGLPYADYAVTGTATGVSILQPYSGAFSRTPASPGQTWSTTFIARRIAGAAPPALCGVRISSFGETAPSTTTETISTAIIEPPLTDTVVGGNITLANGATNQASAQVDIRTASGATVNYTVRIKAFQFELGSARTTYQPAVSGELRNLLTYSQQFDNAVWQKQNCTILTNSAIAPDGTSTADKIQETAVTAAFSVGVAATMAFSTTYTLSVYMKAAERSFGVLNIFTGAASCWTWYDLASGTVGTVGSGATASISSVGNGWYRCVLTIATAASGSPNVAMWPAPANNTLTYAGTLNSGILIWGAQLEQASTYSRYQQVVTANEWYEPGFTSYRGIRFDGVDDFLQTAAIDFSNSDKMTVVAGVRKLSDAAAGTLVALSATPDATNGAFELRAPAAAQNYAMRVRGSLGPFSAASGAFAAPDAAVLSGLADLSGDSASIRRNGVVVATNAPDFGTGNFTNDVVYIGRQGGTSQPLNGVLTFLCVINRTLTAAELAQLEAFANSRTGAF